MDSNTTIQKIIVFTLIVLSIWIIPAGATIFAEDGTELNVEDLYVLTNTTHPANNTYPVIFFYDPECGPCIPVHEYLIQYLSENPGIEVEMVNLSSGQEAEIQMSDLYIQHNRTMMNTPVIFFGPMGVEGTDEIINGFESLYHWYRDEDCNCSSL